MLRLITLSILDHIYDCLINMKGSWHVQVVSTLDLCNNDPRFLPQGLGLCSRECFIHFAHFPSLAAWLYMTCDVERDLKLESFFILFHHHYYHLFTTITSFAVILTSYTVNVCITMLLIALVET